MKVRTSFGAAVLVASLATACGGAKGDGGVVTVAIDGARPPPGEVTAVDPPSSAARPAPPKTSALARIVLAGAHAMVSATRGEPYDPAWNCEDASAPDLRATKPEVKERLQSKAPGRSALVFGLEGFVVTPAGSSDSTIDRGVKANLVVWPDGRLNWADLDKGHLDGDTIPLAQLPQRVSAPVDEFVAWVTSPTCSRLGMTEADVDALPFPADRKKDVHKRLRDDAGETAAVCARMLGAPGPWRVSARRVLAMFFAGADTVLVKSDVLFVNGKLCLGPAEVESRGAN